MTYVHTAAHNQWISRPADERFGSLEALHEATTHHKAAAVEAVGVDLRKLTVAMRDFGDRMLEPVLIGETGKEARFTNHGFKQLATRIGAPANYLRTLPGELVTANFNYGLSHSDASDDALLFAKNGELRLRAALSGSYRRIWNADITERLLSMTALYPQWQPAPAAFDGSRGLYASDEDMFAFLVDNNRRIFETGPAGGLSRGFMVSNSEVGTGSFVITTFMYEYVCGNHRVWGVSNQKELRIRHVGNADASAFDQLGVELTKYADGSAKDDEAAVTRMQTKVLASSKEELLDMVFGLRINGLSRRVIEQSYELAETREDWYGNPRSVWGLTGGMTEVARDLPNANDRVALERAAGKVMALAL